MKTKESIIIYQLQQRETNRATGKHEWQTIADHFEATIPRAQAEIAIRHASGNKLPMRWKPLRVKCNLQSNVSTSAQGKVDPRFL
jgi:hypothetical protein